MGGGKSASSDFLLPSHLEEFRWKFEFLVGADGVAASFQLCRKCAVLNNCCFCPSSRVSKVSVCAFGRSQRRLETAAAGSALMFHAIPQTNLFHSPASIGRHADSRAGELSRKKQLETS